MACCTRSSSHTVAAYCGCTNIPLTAGGGAGGRDHSYRRLLRTAVISVRPPGSGRTDQVRADWGQIVAGAAFITAPSMTTPAVVYRHSAIRSLRARATMIVFRPRDRRRPLDGGPVPHQGLAIDPVGLRPPTPARGQDRGGVDDVALDPFRLQHPVEPKTIQTGLLDDNNREVPAGPRHSFAPELGEPTQQPRYLARRNRVLGHLLPAPRRQGRDQPGSA